RRDRGGRLYPDPKSIEAAAAMLATAERPLIITGTVGRNPEAVGHLVALAESFAIPVVVFGQRYMGFPTNHPLHLGFSPDPMLATADAILVIDSDVPCFPSTKNHAGGSKVIHLGLDAIYS